MLAATGRPGRMDGLGLERTGVRNEKKGILQYTHVAAYEGHLAGHNAFAEEPVAVELDGIPRITFADPPLAGVGISETEARRRRLDPIVARASVEGMGRALVEGWSGGLVALVADRQTGRLLEGSMWAPEADAVIHEIAALVRNGATVRELRRTIHAYPSYNEVLSEAAAQLDAQRPSPAA